MKKIKKEKRTIKTKPTKRQRADSITAAVGVAQAAFMKIEPPQNIRMSKKDMQFFELIVEEFARAEWTGHQLQCAGMLARAMVDMEDEQYRLRKEGMVIKVKSKKGNIYNVGVNPRKVTVQMCAATILSLRRSLSLHARARAGESRDISGRRGLSKKIETDLNSIDDPDELFARPTMKH